METIALEAAREVGFEPRTYSSFLQHKKIREHVDFISELDESGLTYPQPKVPSRVGR